MNITANGYYKITGVTTSYKVTVSSGVSADIILDGVDIKTSSTACAFDMTGATVKLILSGTNTLQSGFNQAGLRVPANATLIITSIAGDGSESGSLTALGGYNGAGIGGSDSQIGGSITINGGTITARGGSGGSGIGGGYTCAGGTITINGGMITAQTTDVGAAIGGGVYGSGGTITVNGGTVIATGGVQSAGLGGGGGVQGSGGTITINGGAVIATGDSSPSIGPGYLATGGTVTLSGGTVVAPQGLSGDSVTVSTTSKPVVLASSGVTATDGILVSGWSFSDPTVNLSTALTIPAGAALIVPWGYTLTGGSLTNSGLIVQKGTIGTTVTVTNGASIVFDNQTSRIGTVTGNAILPNVFQVAADETIEVPAGQQLTVPAGKTVTNNGTIYIRLGASLKIDGTLINNGTIIIKGTMDITNGGTLINNGTVTVNSGGEIDIDSGGTLINNGTINNSGAIDDDGTLDNNPGGVINNNSGGEIDVNNGGELDNNGTINNNTGGEIDVNTGGTIDNDGTIDTSGGYIYDNGGVINNNGTINNSSSNDHIISDPTVALLISVANQTVAATLGSENGSPSTPRTASVTVPNSQASIVSTDIKAVTGATALLYCTNQFSVVQTQPIALTEGVPASLYILVVAADNLATQHYKV
ncbi:MAG: autotransporter adhesin family protein, partial [Synergistaceae bacterium]|nr:autotransporter adhesin family protein [Synergistaceae bacterium]